MSFDNLWEKYGEKKLPQPMEPRVEKKSHENPREEFKEYKKEDIPVKKEKKSVDKKDDLSPMTGVFGNENEIDIENSGSKRNRNWDFEPILNWPWLDIIFGTITVAMIIGVVLNFEKVTTTIFNILLPLLCNIIVLLFVVGIIIFVIWWFTPRRRRW